MKTAVQQDNHRKRLFCGLILFGAFFCVYLIVLAFYVLGNSAIVLSEILTYLGVMFMLFSGMFYFVFYSDVKLCDSLRKCATLAVTIVLSMLLTIVFSKVLKLPFLVPYSFSALIIAMTLNNKSGFFVSLNVILAFFAAQLLFVKTIPVELYYPLFGGVFASVLASYFANGNSSRLRYVWTGIKLGLFSMISAIICYFMFYAATFEMNRLVLIAGTSFASGILSVMLIFIFVPLYEKVFNLTTNFRLMEMTSTGQPLLRKLFEVAPGTFNHSLTVANYAEACASAIGANPYLARAAAYYHDIGKIKNPNYFIENQSDGHNLHDELTPEASVLAIKKHVVYGAAIAKEYHFPAEVQRAIIEHHGTMPIKYFYLKAKKYTDGNLPLDDYRYDGPIPTTKIAAILMIVDACEAALRAQGARSDAAKVVDDIVQERMDFNQFIDCDLTLHEIDVVKSTILATYLGIKHERIKYPKKQLKEN